MKLPTGGHYRSLAEINITPFVDVVLVLLIIFMITAPLLQQGLPVELPKATSPEIQRTPDDLIVTVNSNGLIYIGDATTPITIEDLLAKLTAIFQTKEKKTILIKADQKLLYGKVVEVMSLAQKAGVERIGMVTQPEVTKTFE